MAYVDPHCRAIATKAAKGKLTESEILDAFLRIDARKKQLEAQGLTTGKGERMRKWAEQEGERAKVAAGMQRRHAALNAITRDRLDRQVARMIQGGLKPHQAIRAVLEGINSPAEGSRASAAAAVQAYEARYLGVGFMSRIAKEKPHLDKLLADPRLDADTLTEMWELRDGGKPGSTNNADAQWLAKTFADVAELSRTELNRLGASIGKLDGWAGVQMHDPIKMMAAGKDAWVGRIVTLLDHARTFPEGVSQTEAADILGDIYDTIITGFPSTKTAPELGQRVNPANLAKTLGASRVLHFQDNKAALSYRDQFGYGNTISGMISHLQHMAKVAGAMETLGPNPEVMFRSIAETLRRGIKEATNLTDPQKVALIGKLNTEAGALKHAIDVTTGLVSRPVNVTAAKIGNDVRAVESMAKLGAALPSSFGDTVTAAAAAQFRGSGFFNGMVQQLSGIMQGRPKGEQAQIAYLLGEGFDGLIGHIVSNGYATDGPVGKLGQMLPGFFKLNALTWWTDVNRGVAGRVIASELGMHAGKPMAALPDALQHVMRQAGISPEEWAVLGKAALRQDSGKVYMTPDGVRNLDALELVPLARARIDAINKSKGSAADKATRIEAALGDARRRLEVKLLSYVADQTSYSIVESDARTRRYTTLGQRGGTMGGEAIRYVMQFKGYPMAFMTRTLGRAIFGQRQDATAAARAAHIGSLLAGLMVAGYMSMVAKDMLKGYWPPRNPSDPRTILAAWQQGGGLGIYGDFLFSKVNRFGGGLTETLAGPAIGSVADLANIGLDARDAAISLGDDKFSGAQAFSTITGSVPYANLHLLKPALDYLILNSLRDALSPGSIQKQLRDRRKEYGQSFLPAQVTGKPALDPLNIARSF
jgi:hypothetical protein